MMLRAARPDIHAGDWVKHSYAGYWQVVDILPGYAQQDSALWRRGDVIFWWALLKKGFTPGMKLNIRCRAVDAARVEAVSPTELARIRAHFAADPEAEARFAAAPWKHDCSYDRVYLRDLTQDEFACVKHAMGGLQTPFTRQQFDAFAKRNGIDALYALSEKQQAYCVLFLLRAPYLYDDDFRQLHMDWELKRMQPRLA